MFTISNGSELNILHDMAPKSNLGSRMMLLKDFNHLLTQDISGLKDKKSSAHFT